MLLVYVIQILLLGEIFGSPIPNCTPQEWGPWGRCITSTGCTTAAAAGYQGASFPLPVSAAPDSGREAMTKTMRKKIEMYSTVTEESPSSSFHGNYKCINGYAGQIPCWNVEQLAFLNFDELGFESRFGRLRWGSDIWGWTDPLTQEEYAIVTLSGGTSFVRVTDPKNPTTVAFLPTHTGAAFWRDVKTVGNFAYVVAESRDHGMQVFDLTRLRGVHTLFEAEADFHYDKVGNSHNIIANEDTGYVYIVGATTTGDGKYSPCAGGLHVVDVKQPLEPKFVGCYAEDGYTHDAQCVIYNGPDKRFRAREICFAFNEDSLTIIDVTDKNKMSMISKRTYEGVQYSHQGWLTDDMALLMLNDELDEFGDDKRTKSYVWDVQNLLDPVLKHTFYHEQTSIDHNEYIKDGFTYQANYEAGLRILHIQREKWNLKEVGYFDVRPDRTTVDFYGAWSSYPYFNSGTVVISSIDYGLFVVKPDYKAMRKEAIGQIREENCP